MLRPAGITRTVHAEGWAVDLDLSPQVLRLEAPDGAGWDEEGDDLRPTIPTDDLGAVSAAALLLKAKQFDDGLLAAVARAGQRGLGHFAGKVTLLTSLAASLSDPPPGAPTAAAALVHAACELGRVPAPVPAGLREAVRDLLDDFLQDELAAKPLGHYTWSAELRAIFQQDRLLQRGLPADVADALRDALDRAPAAAAAHHACLRLDARLTDPPLRPGLADGGPERHFFPPARTHEALLFERLHRNSPVPDGFDLMDELIRQVRSGQVRLEPRSGSGWYDHQTWSLEPLLLPDRAPESAKLHLGPRYRKHLEDLFRGALALARETHVKQAGAGGGGYGGPRQRPIWVRPGLTVEPLPTLYARRAASYRFVRGVLEEAFGPPAVRQMRRLTADGTVGLSLAEELGVIERLFAGASASSCRELGLPPLVGGEADCRAFHSWRGAMASDIDVSRDVRMMIPVYHDLQRRQTKVWALLGWRSAAVDVEYASPPRVAAVRSANARPPAPDVLFSSEEHLLATPVVAEVYVGRLLDRDQFRRHCDRHRTREAILAHLA